MGGEIKKTGLDAATVQTLPEEWKPKKKEGKPYAFYSYRHYEVFPGDLFFGVIHGYLVFALASYQGKFVPIDKNDLFEMDEDIPLEEPLDWTLKGLPFKAGQIGCASSSSLEAIKTRLEEYEAKGIVAYAGPNCLKVIKESFGDDPVELRLGFFEKGSLNGKKFSLPSKLQNEGNIVLNGKEKGFLEPYFEIDDPFVKAEEGEKTTSCGNEEKIIFRKFATWDDFFNLLEERKPRLLLDSSSLRARVAHPYLTIPKEWVHGIYQCYRGTLYDLNDTYWYFAEQFVHNIGLSIVNLKQQMMPYYQRHHSYPIPRDLLREDVMFLCSKWFVQDVRDGRYYHLQPTYENEDGSYFCLDEKWFSLFYDRVRRYGKKKVCPIDSFKFRSSKDKRYFRLFCLEEEDLAYAFERAIDVPTFEDFFFKMYCRFNPMAKKKGEIENTGIDEGDDSEGLDLSVLDGNKGE